MRHKRLSGFIAVCWLAMCIFSLASAAEPKWDVGIRDSYLKGLGARDIWSAADMIGVSQIEVQVDAKMQCPQVFEDSGAPYGVGTADMREQIRKKLAEKKKSICAFCCPYGYGKGSSDEEAVKWLSNVAEAASDLGVPVIMVPLPGAPGMKDEEYIERTKKLLGSLVPIAEKTGVAFAMENLQRYNNRPEIFEPILKSLPPNRVGIAHDATNMYWYGYPTERIYALAEMVAPHVRYVHAKNERYPDDKKNVQREPGWEYVKHATSVRDGDIDFRRLLGIYAKAGFRGVVTIEDDSLGKHDAEGKKKVLTDDVVFLREIISGLEK